MAETVLLDQRKGNLRLQQAIRIKKVLASTSNVNLSASFDKSFNSLLNEVPQSGNEKII